MGRTDKEIYRVIDNVNSYYRINSESKKELLLNKYPNAAAAYSLRLLDGYYRGPLVRVRRDDGNEVDVYPDYNNELSLDSLVSIVDTGANTTENPLEPPLNPDPTFTLSLQSLGEFVGATGYSDNVAATDATVCVWYDQSSTDGVPNDNDAKQVVALNQPLIVSSGVIVTENGKPAVEFVINTFQRLAMTLLEPTANFFLSFLANVPLDKMPLGHTTATVDSVQYRADDTTIRIRYNQTIDFTGGTNLSDRQVILEIKRVSGVLEVYENGNSIGTNSTALNFKLNSIGNGYQIGSSSYTGGVVQEFIFWDIDQSTNRSDIEEDINSFYQIDGYTPTPKLIDLTQALAVENGDTIADGTPAAAYSLRLLSSTYNGPLVRIRRTIDNTEVDVYPDSDGEFSIYSTIQDGGTELTTGVTGGSTDKTTLHEFLYGQDTDCMVVRWYDQASGNHATQDVATSQPKIYDSVAGVVTENGKPAVNPQSRYGMPTGINGLTDLTVFAIGNNTFNGSQNFPRIISSYAGTGSLGANAMIFRYNSSTSEFNFNTSSGAVSISGSQPQNFLAIIRKTSNTIDIGLNGSVYSSATSTAALTDQIYLLEDVGGTQMEACRGINEIIIYNSSQSDANRTGIEQNINQHYNIY